MNNDILFLLGSIIVIAVAYLMLFQEKQKQKQKKKITKEDILKEKDNIEKEKQIKILQKQENENEEKKKKDLARERKKEEKRQRQEEERQRIEDQRKRMEERQKKLDMENQIEIEKEEKELKILRELEEERKKKEEEEYNKWKDTFTIEEAGLEIDNDINEENLLNKFIDYIKLRKVVTLEDLSNTFKLKTKDILDRVKNLEENNLLRVIIDENGKMIYIEEEEIKKLKEVLNKKGRITRTEMIKEFSNIISLEPSEEKKLKIKEEEDKYTKLLENDLKDE